MKTKIFKIKAAILLTIGLLFGSASAKAEDGYLVLSTMSLHFENFDERNCSDLYSDQIGTRSTTGPGCQKFFFRE